MGRRKQTRELAVWMNEDAVGSLRQEPSRLVFRYDLDWLTRPLATPLSSCLPLSADPYAGDLVESFFDNLMPDGEGIRRRMQVVLGARSTRPFDLLEAAGADCVGALSLLSPGCVPNARDVRATPISNHEIAELLRPKDDHPLGMTREDVEFRISIAGAQEKTGLLWFDQAWHRPHGATPTSHIFKPPIGSLGLGRPDMSDSVENEWLCLRLLRSFGLPVARAEIGHFEDAKALVVERFDRVWSEDGSWLVRLPQEDLCQALGVPPARKYESDGGPGIEAAMELLDSSQFADRDRETFMQANLIFWLLAAIDGHAKNFSLRLHAGGRTELLPLYDVLSAYPALGRGQLWAQKLRMAMSVRGKNRHYRWLEITPGHWRQTAKRCGFSESRMQAVMDECAGRIEPAIAEVERALPNDFDASLAEAIFDGLRAMKARLA